MYSDITWKSVADFKGTWKQTKIISNTIKTQLPFNREKRCRDFLRYNVEHFMINGKL